MIICSTEKYPNKKKNYLSRGILASALIGFFITFCYTVSYGQNFEKDYKKWQQSFENLKTFSTDMDILIYENYDTKKVYQTRKASVMKKDNSFKMKIDQLEILYADSLSLMINHTSKNMTLGSYYPDSIDFSQKVSSIDTLLAHLDSTVYLGTQNNLKTYKIYFSKGLVEQLYVSFNTTSHLLEKTVYFYNKLQAGNLNVVEIVLKNTQINEDFANDVILLEKYLQVKSGIIVPSHEFSSYKLHYEKEE